MNKILILGTGESSKIVFENIIKTENTILAFIDNDRKKQGTLFNNIKIMDPTIVKEYDFDYIILATLHYESAMEDLKKYGIESKKLLAFYDININYAEQPNNIFNIEQWRYDALRMVYDNKLRELNLHLNNLKYEIGNSIESIRYPIIYPAESAINLIVKTKCSLARFGDGEFELMAGKNRPNFQHVDTKLSIRLKEILNANKDNLLIAIADNYGSLNQYDEKAAAAIRNYMTPQVRSYHYSVLDMDKIYYDAYISRPYVIYKDKTNVKMKFEKIKKIWDNRHVVIIEGEYSRLGVGNDLFDNMKSVQRILAPSEEAFSKYDEILEVSAKMITKDKLVLIALGPTATVLAFDLACMGYQAIDIGHIDIEYEWFLRGQGKKVAVNHKYNNEVPGGYIVEQIEDREYKDQIMFTIL